MGESVAFKAGSNAGGNGANRQGEIAAQMQAAWDRLDEAVRIDLLAVAKGLIKHNRQIHSGADAVVITVVYRTAAGIAVCRVPVAMCEWAVSHCHSHACGDECTASWHGWQANGYCRDCGRSSPRLRAAACDQERHLHFGWAVCRF